MKKKILTFVLTAVMFVFLAITAFAYSKGDVNNSGDITAADARLTLRYSASLQSLDDEQIAAADVDKSGEVTASDARTILRVSAGLDSFTSAEELNALLIEPGVLNVAVCADNPPFCYMKNGQLTGVDVDVAQKYANNFGLELKLHNMTYDEIINSAKSEKYDIAITRTPYHHNLQQQGIKEQYYTYIELNAYFYKDSTYMTAEQLKNDTSKKIGVYKNSLADIIITNEVKNGEYAENRIVRYSKYANAFNDLANGKIYAFIDEKVDLFNDDAMTNGKYYLYERYSVLSSSDKFDLLSKFTMSITSDTVQQIIDSYCSAVITENSINCKTSSVTLAPGGTALIEATFESIYRNDHLIIDQSEYDVHLNEYQGKYYIIVSIPENATSGKLVCRLNLANSTTHTINVNVSKSSGAKYNFGTTSYCPDFGAFAGVAPDEVVIDTENQAIGYVYNAEKLYNAGLTESTDYEKYLELLEKQGFVADSYMTDDYSYYMLLYANESIEEAVAYTEYYYFDGVYLYLTAVSVVVSHQF